jgi:hypothetical protein
MKLSDFKCHTRRGAPFALPLLLAAAGPAIVETNPKTCARTCK